MTRDLIIIANWKMYKTAREAADYVEWLGPRIAGTKAKIYLAVPYTAIAAASHAAKSFGIYVGAQNLSDEKEGALTGEISAMMLKDAGACFAMIGHSERRNVFHEDDELIHRKLLRALKDDLQPVLCIGETAIEREEGRAHDVLKRQLLLALKDIPHQNLEKIIISYEPVWAIGTGKTASPKAVQESHAFIRQCLDSMMGKHIADRISLLYGGSVTPDNVKELVSQKDVDGVLVGGASLDPEKFSVIIHHSEGKK